MKNAELENLQDLSNRVVAGLPPLLLRGDGRFLNDGEVVASSEVLEKLHDARLRAIEMRDALAGVKRRTIKAA